MPITDSARASRSDLISWDVAEQVALRVAGWRSAVDQEIDRYMEADFAQLVPVAEGLVEAATGLHPKLGPAKAKVTDRAGWVRANLASFERLLSPVMARMDRPIMPGVVATASRASAGFQLGVVLGWMSTRVLGQYDLLLAEDRDSGDQDVVYFVGPNVVALERRHGFEPRQFRLWLALHEVTHRAQFTAIPWMRDHFLSLVEQGLQAANPDPRQILEAVKHAASEALAGRNPLGEAGLLGLVAQPAQREVISQIQALMSLLEGHGDVTMDRAGAQAVPSAELFSRLLRERRQQGTPVAKLARQLLGFEAKMRQYEQGEQFIYAVESIGGPDLLAHAWRGPQWLPSLLEIRQPSQWVSRVQSLAAVG
ncbi:MAG: zinc-dependent metalloprotease [Actinobacteria bacterium]|nr:zinc-dependent metalloprotease [Actinomycetota bacterium]